MSPPVAVKVMVVDVPLHIEVMSDDKPVGASEGGVFAVIAVVVPPVTVALHAPVPFSRTQ
jgi:hypothetical protein